jgi:hypothetical protein
MWDTSKLKASLASRRGTLLDDETITEKECIPPSWPESMKEPWATLTSSSWAGISTLHQGVIVLATFEFIGAIANVIFIGI